MKLEVGKFYKTRAGEQAVIYNLDGGGFQPVHGAVQLSGDETSGKWIQRNWTEVGIQFGEIESGWAPWLDQQEEK